MAGLTIDTRQTFLTRQLGDVICCFTWINDERAMILLAAYRKNSPFYVILESRAYEYDDPVQLAQSATKACEVLGFESSRATWVRIATIIHEGLPDLIRMPAAPIKDESDGLNVGEMHLMANGQAIKSDYIKDEPAGVTYGV